ncbi:hypothetical protein ABT187_49350 [Streptomyces sp. NPDC001817]|uniref:hypothetical protein n=1 Tax=Streptomyces sp. NPDC001817 TaxID=3154398 RepID=UPI0033286F2E
MSDSRLNRSGFGTLEVRLPPSAEMHAARRQIKPNIDPIDPIEPLVLTSPEELNAYNANRKKTRDNTARNGDIQHQLFRESSDLVSRDPVHGT